MTFADLDEFRAALDGENAETILSAITSKYRSASDSYYDEGILTSYRLYDAIEELEQPRYDFGYGLSYTTFEFSDLKVEAKADEGEEVGYDVTFKVTNTGDVAGREVAQLYLGEAKNLPEGIQSAPVQLAGFQKTATLEPGASETVTIHVSQRSLSYWNQNLEDVLDKWTIAEGERTIYVGNASDNLILQEEVDVQAGAFQFDDVQDSGKFYYNPVYWAFNAEPQITNGIDDTHFGPDASCTRGQVVTFLWRAAGCPEPKSTKTNFTDLKAGAFYEKAVAWAVENGITDGMTKTTFAPDKTCTRSQIVTFLWRYAGKTEPKNTSTGFKDVADGAFYAKPVAWAVENEVTNGLSADKFGPDATCTRGQVVTFLYRATNGK